MMAWQDEQHVVANRALYRAKYDAVLEILAPVMDIQKPDGGFYLWPSTHISDIEFTKQLYMKQNVLVVPGSYLSREIKGINPGANRIRMALVASLGECIEAANRIVISFFKKIIFIGLELFKAYENYFFKKTYH